MDSIFGRIKAKRGLSPEVYGQLDDYHRHVGASQDIVKVISTGKETDHIGFTKQSVAPIEYNRPFNISDLGLEVKAKE